MMNLENKKIIITGATGGIGNSIVERVLEGKIKVNPSVTR